MNRILIYIGDYLLDLYDRSVIAITYQLVDIRDLKLRKVSFSSTIDLPPTENNLSILGNPQNIKSGSTKPYSQLSAKCISNGIEYFSGRFEISEVKKTIKTNIYENVIDVFDLIKGKKLVDLSYLPNSEWNADDIDGYRNSSSGIIAPVINWGQFNTTTPSVNSTLYLPSYFYKDLVLAILEATGFNFQGDALFDNSDIDDLIIPFPQDNFEYIERYTDDTAFEVTQASDQVITSPTANTQYGVVMDSIISQGLFNFFDTSLGVGRYFVLPDSGFLSTPVIGGLNATLNITVIVSTSAGGGGGTVFNISIKDDTGGTLVTTGNITLGIGTQTYKRIISVSDTDIRNGFEYFPVITVGAMGGPIINSITVDAVLFYGNLTRRADRNFLIHNYLLPDIEQIDILKDYFTRIGAFMTLDKSSNTVSIRTLKEIINNKSSCPDWTDKRVKYISDRVIFEYESYSKDNLFKYKEGDGVKSNLGEGSLVVNNENLEPESDYFESVFENCLTQNPDDDFNVNMAYIPVYDNTSSVIEDFVNRPGLKLLTIRDKETDEPSITFNLTARSDYKVAYFIDSSQIKDTGFEYFIDRYYSELQLSFDKTKLIERNYILSEVDVLNDITIIFDSGNYFLVNKIPKFIPNRITENVELLRIF